MKYKYHKIYNYLELYKIIDCISFAPEQSLLKLQQYLREYPNDYVAYVYYMGCLINVGKFDEADDILQFLEFNKKNYYDYSDRSDVDNMGKVEITFIINKIRLFMYLGMYDKAYSLCVDNFDDIYSKFNRIYSVRFFLENKLGICERNRDHQVGYLYKQILEYREDDFLDHIKKHLYNETGEELSSSVFNPQFPINDVINEVKGLIPSSDKLCMGFFDNQYIFKYDYCGKTNYKTVDYLKVSTFHDTKDIITIFPFKDGRLLNYYDLNYLNESIDNCKVRKRDRVSSFNRRYGFDVSKE